MFKYYNWTLEKIGLLENIDVARDRRNQLMSARWQRFWQSA